MSKRDDERKEMAKSYAREVCSSPCDLVAAAQDYEAGAKWADEHPSNPWRNLFIDGHPECSMFVLANLGFNYIVCEYKADTKEWWQCDGYIAGYSPEHKPLFSAKTKLTSKEVELIINYMEIPTEPIIEK